MNSLEIASWSVNALQDGDRTQLVGCKLEIDRSEIATIANDAALGRPRIELVSPSEEVRIINVLDAVAPSLKPDKPNLTFSGVLGPAEPTGSGITHRLNGVNVVITMDLAPWRTGIGNQPDGDSIIDMAGPMALHSPIASTHNIVVSYPAPSALDAAAAAWSVCRVACRVARCIAERTTRTRPPDRIKRITCGSPTGDRPAIGVVIPVASEGPLLETWWYGEPFNRMEPIRVNPTEVLDGALVCGHFDHGGLRVPTASYQRSSLIRTLSAADGTTIDFVAVVLSRAYRPSYAEKRRWAEASADLLAAAGADGAIIGSFQSGNSHTDTMQTVAACERLGISTVAIVSETDTGLIDHVREADSLVSAGNEDALGAVWLPRVVLGGTTLADGVQADAPRALPMASYFAAISQIGDGRLQAVPA